MDHRNKSDDDDRGRRTNAQLDAFAMSHHPPHRLKRAAAAQVVERLHDVRAVAGPLRESPVPGFDVGQGRALHSLESAASSRPFRVVLE